MNEWQLEFGLDQVAKGIFYVLLFLLIISLIVTIIPSYKSELKLHPTWKVGSIDDGIFNKKDKSSLVSQLLYLGNGLKIEIDHDQSLTFQIIFYDGNSNYLGISDEFSQNVVLTYSELQKRYLDVKAYRVVIKKIDKSGYINIFEKDIYSNYISIYEINH